MNLHLAASKSNKKLLKSLGAENIKILPNGVDIDKFNFSKDRNEKKIVFIGRLEKRKGIHILIDSLKKIETQVKLVIIGPSYNDKYSKEIMSKIDEENKEGKHEISYLGPLSHENIIKILKESMLLVCPSISEDFGMVIIEAMSCGTPVIASDIGGIKDIITNHENGIVIPPENDSELARSIEYLINNHELRSKLSINGRKTVEDKYSWESIVKRLSRIYETLI